MKKNNLFLVVKLFISIVLIGTSYSLKAQAELNPWGNMAGIRIDGQLMEFESSLRVVKSDWSSIKSTGKEKQRPHYAREGDQQVVKTIIDSLHFTVAVTDSVAGSARLDVQVEAKEDVEEDIYFCLNVPEEYYSKGSLQAGNSSPITLNKSVEEINKYLGSNVSALRFVSEQQQLQLDLDEPARVIVRKENHLQFYIAIHKGKLSNSTILRKRIAFKAAGQVDKTPVMLQVNTEKTGNEFIGLGGNFRLQNPKADPQVIDYCLEHLRVAFGRVEMPWRFWQRGKMDNPIDSARKGRLHPAVEKAMLMAQRLSKKGMPVVLSAWSAPAWAVVGEPKFRPGPDGVWGNPLDSTNMQEIYKSIGDYIIYLRDQYGVEIGYFSFNESDLGINIRQTGQEHADLIKGLGAYFVQAGLKTKMLLGDNSDATTYAFIDPALKDTATHRYIGAVSFHSWRGWDKETLQKWADAAAELHLPLIVGEGSIDAQAWGYPAIFEEQTYAMEEINLYIRILSICQPASILQWQLTSDYSPLSGGGVFGNNDEPLHPTQRFWNLKQLASTPQGLKAIGAVSDKEVVTVAALGNQEKGIYAIHLVNNGPTRKATLNGLPGTVKSLKIFITDKQRAVKEQKRIAVNKGKAVFTLEAGTYTTLSSQ